MAQTSWQLALLPLFSLALTAFANLNIRIAGMVISRTTLKHSKFTANSIRISAARYSVRRIISTLAYKI
jgi:hypothetical protein